MCNIEAATAGPSMEGGGEIRVPGQQLRSVDPRAKPRAVGLDQPRRVREERLSNFAAAWGEAWVSARQRYFRRIKQCEDASQREDSIGACSQISVSLALPSTVAMAFLSYNTGR